MALSSFLRARLVPRSAPLMEACSRSRRDASSRVRSSSSWWRIEAVARKKPSVGMPVSSAMIWSASAGSSIDWPSYSRRTVPREPANVFSSVPRFWPSSSSCSNSMVTTDLRLRRGVPRSKGFEVAGRAGDATGDGQLDRALDGGLAGLVGPAHDGQPGCEVDVELAVAADLPELEAADPHSEISCPASSRRPSRSESRSSAASSTWPAFSQAAMRASRSRMKAPATVSGDGSDAARERRHRPVADAHLEERGREARLDLVDVEVEVVRPDPDEPDVEHEVRVGALLERVDQRGLALDRGGVELGPVEPGPSDDALLDGHDPLAGRLVQLDQQHLAGPVLVQGDRLRCARVRIRHGPAAPLLGRVPVPEGEIVEMAGRDLVDREDDLVAVRLARDRQRAMDHPDAPLAGGLRLGGVEPSERTGRGTLGGEDPAMDDRVDRIQVDGRLVRREDRQEVVRLGAAGEGLEVVRAVDRRAVVDVVGARDDDGPDARLDQASQLGGDALHGTARLHVGVEQVAGDQDQVDALRDGEVHRGGERRELTLALGSRLLSEVIVTGAEMDVGGVDDP